MITEQGGSPTVQITASGTKVKRVFKLSSDDLNNFLSACATDFAYVDFLGGVLLSDIDLKPFGVPNEESIRGTEIDSVMSIINTYGKPGSLRHGGWDATLTYDFDSSKAISPDKDQSNRSTRKSGKEDGPEGSIYTATRSAETAIFPLEPAANAHSALPAGTTATVRVPMVKYSINWARHPDINWRDIDRLCNTCNSVPIRVPVFDVLCSAGTLLFLGATEKEGKKLEDDGTVSLDRSLDMEFKWREAEWDSVPDIQGQTLTWINVPNMVLRRSFAPLIP